MADAFGTGAGIVGVISLTIQIAQIAVKFGLDWKDAPDSIKSFMVELSVLKSVLSEAYANLGTNANFANAFYEQPSVLLSQLGPNSTPDTETKVLMRTCEKRLRSLLNELEKRSQGHSLGWNRFKSAFTAKDTRDSVEDLSRQFRKLNSVISVDIAVITANTHKEVKDGRLEQQEGQRLVTEITTATRNKVDRLVQHSEDEEKSKEFQTMLDWLSPHDYASQQQDFITRSQEGTGQWLLNCPEFRQWRDTDQQTLFCPGIPGAGKTLLTSIVIDHLVNRYANDKTTGIAYLYCNFRRTNEQTAQMLLESLLMQLTTGLSVLPRSVATLYDKYKSNNSRPSIEELTQVLQSVIGLHKTTFILLDALDECSAAQRNRERLLGKIFAIQQAQPRTKLFVTSRGIVEIEQLFKDCVRCEIIASDEDIERYIDGQISSLLPKCVRKKPDLQEEIKKGISHVAEGMFLLAELYLRSLGDKMTIKLMRKALGQLQHRGTDGDETSKLEILSQAYDQAIERINGQEPGFRKLAIDALSWISCARRPLTTVELQEALAIELDEPILDKDNIPDIDDIVSACAGLVTIDEETEIIRLVHYTTQEYVMRTKDVNLPAAEAKIATSCTRYLSLDAFDINGDPSFEEFDEIVRPYPLYLYAALNWGIHARIASAPNRHVIQFLCSRNHVKVAGLALLSHRPPSHQGSHYYFYNKLCMTGLSLAAYFGALEAVVMLLKMGLDANEQHEKGLTPLLTAADQGHQRIVEALLAIKDINANYQDEFGRTPLLRAAAAGHDGVVKLLLALDDIKVHQKDRFGRTPLLETAMNGHENVVDILLGVEGIDVNLTDKYGRTPLSCAVAAGHESVIKMLLEIEETDVNTQDIQGNTPFSEVVQHGRDSMVRLFFARKKVNHMIANNGGKTPLHYGITGSCRAVFECLLAQDEFSICESIPNIQHAFFVYAMLEGDEIMLRQIMDNGKIHFDSKNSAGLTPLAYAARMGNVSMVQRLVAIEIVDVNSEDRERRTPMIFAAREGHMAVVQLLLTLPTLLIDEQDETGRTPLHHAIGQRHHKVVQTLLSTKKVNFNNKDEDGETALFTAVLRGNEHTVELLLSAYNIDVDAGNTFGETPLHMAVYQSTAMTRLLLATGKVEIDAKDNDGNTPYSIAVKLGNQEIIKLLGDYRRAQAFSKAAVPETLAEEKTAATPSE